MNYENNTMLTSPNLSYTSRDYNSIYNELMKSIPLLTKSWDPKDENDPGVVLIKLISMLGDMLSYNLDKNALEAFPRTVLQRANAQQIFRLIGYKMHWWRSARTEARFTNANSFPVYIGRYNTFGTNNPNIVYSNVSPIIIPGATYGTEGYPVELIQGIPVVPTIKSNAGDIDNSDSWHEAYDYNILASDVVNNRVYLSYSNIDETSITLIDNDETQFIDNEWKLVDNINLSEKMEKVFEFDVDENNRPFIQFPSYWNQKYVITKFKIFFILSNGKNGEIGENVLNGISPARCYLKNSTMSVSEALKSVQIFNSSSTYGYNPETCTEARIESEKYQNTIDTLVTLPDFEKAVRRIESVANVIATDIQTDPNASDMTDTQVNLYIVRKSDYNNLGSNYAFTIEGSDDENDTLFKENIVGELQSYKVIPTDIDVKLENYIDWVDWTVTGQIFLRKPINADQHHDLLVKINDALNFRFNCETLDFNEPINYMDVIECIMKVDSNIWLVDLDTAAVQFSKPRRNKFGNPTGFKIKDKFMIYNDKNEYTGYYITSFGCSTTEIDKISDYVDVYHPLDGYLAGTGSKDIKSTTIVNVERQLQFLNADDTNTIAPGGDGSGKNAGNRIVRDDGADYVIGLFGLNEPREYEVYNNNIYDWTGLNPIFTGKIINTKSLQIQEYDSNGNKIDTPYRLVADSRMYLPDGSDAGEYLISGYRQITPLCDITSSDDIISNSQLNNLSNDEIANLVTNNKLREVWLFINREYNDPTGEVVDKLTGEIFRQRGDYWYTTNKSYNSETGDICDTHGSIVYGNNGEIIRDVACREDITAEYIQFMNIKENQTDFAFYLGQDCDGNYEYDSAGNIIHAYPIKPYSLYIYIDGDVEVLADTGSGQINGTPGLLNGHGSINYATGFVSFKLNVVPTSMKIMYKVNKFTYARYVSFDTDKLYVRPEFLRSDIRK